jgi:ribokinase
MAGKWVTVMGSYVADLAFRTDKLPAWGETFMGSSFQLGPGGKGSNQAVAAARAGAKVSFISKLGEDAFGDMARATYRTEGVDTRVRRRYLSMRIPGRTRLSWCRVRASS